MSHTPQAALVKFAVMAIDVATLPMRDMTTPAPVEQQARAGAPTSASLGKGKQAPTAKTVTEHLYDLLAVNPTLRPADLLRLTGCSEGLASRAPRAYFAAHPQQQAHPTEKPRPTVAHKAPRPPLSQEVHRRLEEAQGRLIEQGLPVTYEWLAHEAHIGYHAIATFLQEQRVTSQREVEQARVQQRPTVL